MRLHRTLSSCCARSVALILGYVISSDCLILTLYSVMLITFIFQYVIVCDTIRLSINQSNFYSPNIPSKARFSGATAKSVFNSKMDQKAMGSDGNYGGKAKSKRCVFRYFIKVATEMAERTNSGRLFQRDGAQEWKVLAPLLVLTLGTNKLLLLFDLSEREGVNAANMEWR